MSKRLLLLLTSLWVFAPGAAHADDFARTATSGPETWKRYEVRGFRLGTPRSALVAKGFTCGKRANSRCYKLTDKRCDQGRCELKEDAFGQWFELNGAKTPLDFMTIATTETDSALAYDIHLYFGPRQLLATESTAGKALIAKYGEPTETSEPDASDPAGGGRWLWLNPDIGHNGPEIIVDCTDNSSYKSTQCNLDVEDHGLVNVERSKQEDKDKQKMRSAQPANAPEL